MIDAALRELNVEYTTPDCMEECVASLLAAKKMVARFAGRMEFGPQALGNRSILFHTSDPEVNQWLNKQLQRSEFMPFAPMTLDRFAPDCYQDVEKGRIAAKYMTVTFDCTEHMRQESPAAVHIDGTARPQLVTEDSNPKMYKILDLYYQKTGRMSIINTSFNMHEEPIVCSPEDAIRAFQLSKIQYMAIGNYLIKNDSFG